MARVIFIDDEADKARFYIERLEEESYSVDLCGFEVDLNLKIASTLPIAMVVDVMGPPPPGYDDLETDGGQATGIALLRRYRPFIVKYKIPVMVLTNRNPAEIRDQLGAMNWPDGQVTVRQKINVSARQLPNVLRQHIGTFTPSG